MQDHRAWAAMLAGDFATAREIYSALQADGQNPALLANKAFAELALREYSAAFDTYVQIQACLESSKIRGQSANLGASVAAWLMQNRTLAKQLLDEELAKIEQRKTAYLDDSFGVSEGAIFFFFGVSSGDDAVIDRAQDFLEFLSKKPLGPSWPPGLAERLLGKEPPTNDIAGDGQLLVDKANVKMLFCDAVRNHLQKGRKEALPLYFRVATTRNPIIAFEWYLARAECEKEM